MNAFKIFAKTLFLKKSTDLSKVDSIYNIRINSLNGKPINLLQFKGKHLLIVNVASKCGFTPQYKTLQKLSDTYNKNLVVIGVPCNQFGRQEPGNTNEIQSFCQINYGVTFLITEKVDVKGTKTHPLYKWLKDKNLNGVLNSSVKWNFQKYLINPEGKLIDWFASTTKPDSIKITKHFN